MVAHAAAAPPCAGMRKYPGMDLSFAFFADSAVVPPDGKLYVLGGGFSALSMASLPGRAAFAVVAGFRFSAADVGQAHQVELRLTDAQGKLVLAPVLLQFQAAGPTGTGSARPTSPSRSARRPSRSPPSAPTDLLSGSVLVEAAPALPAEVSG